MNRLVAQAYDEQRFRSNDDDAQEYRWEVVAHAAYRNVALGIERPALLPPNTQTYAPLVFRCSDARCRAALGELFVIDTEWHGRPFSWVETTRVVDRDARPPIVRRSQMILDDFTIDLHVLGECVRHGMRIRAVREVLDRLAKVSPTSSAQLAVPLVAATADRMYD